jgi:hypothetical protein
VVGSGGYSRQEEDSELIHDFLKSVLSILTYCQSSGPRTILCISCTIAIKRTCRCLSVLMIIIRVHLRSLDTFAANGTSSSRRFNLGRGGGGVYRLHVSHVSGRCQPRCLHIQIQRRVHVDQAHVGKPDFPTSTCGEVCGLAYYLRLWVFESCQVACDYLVNISFGCAESDLSREGSKWRSPGTQVTVRRQ